MGTTRKLPDSNIGRRQALNTAKGKMDSLDAADNILTAKTTDRLNINVDKYNTAFTDIAAALVLYYDAIEKARSQRLLLRKWVKNYFASLKLFINAGEILPSARAFYELGVTNTRQPNISSDEKLLAVAAKVISGDFNRRAKGGVALNTPTIEEFTDIYNTAKPIIMAISNTRTALKNEQRKLRKLKEEVDDVIVHIWDEIEAEYSKNTPSSRRTLCRQWGAKFITKGVESVVTGVCAEKTSNKPLPKVKIHIIGSGHKVVSDADSKFSVNTSLYGDLELVATLFGYEDQTINFFKDDGVPKVVNVVMMLKIITT